jgi:tol-pal system protein YbgF
LGAIFPRSIAMPAAPRTLALALVVCLAGGSVLAEDASDRLAQPGRENRSLFNQQLEGQLRRMQEDADFRAGVPAPRSPVARTPNAPTAPATPATPTRRPDVFDPTQSPTAPGAPRPLGTLTSPSAPETPGPIARTPQEVGPPRPPGAPLDLSPQAVTPVDPNLPRDAAPIRAPAPGTPQAVLPPTNSAKDLYDLAYGYVLRRDYQLAEETLRKFLAEYPNDRLAPEAFYWLGESQFQRQLYRDAAENFLKISTDYPNLPKAPDALLRLGQSLAALNERETACAAFGEIGRKYPRASAAVKQAVAQEQRRVRC